MRHNNKGVKLIDKLITGLTCLVAILYDLLMLPYLLWLAWGRILLLKKEMKCLDFDYRGG